MVELSWAQGLSQEVLNSGCRATMLLAGSLHGISKSAVQSILLLREGSGNRCAGPKAQESKTEFGSALNLP